MARVVTRTQIADALGSSNPGADSVTRPTPPELTSDPNLDGSVDVADLGEWVRILGEWCHWLLATPGDAVLVVLIVEFPDLAARWGLSTADYGGWFSLSVSFGIAVAVIAGIVSWRWSTRARP